jgi:hypothetical protein
VIPLPPAMHSPRSNELGSYLNLGIGPLNSMVDLPGVRELIYDVSLPSCLSVRSLGDDPYLVFLDQETKRTFLVCGGDGGIRPARSETARAGRD